MFNKALKYLNKGNGEKALQFFKKTGLDCKEVFLNMGTAYKMLGKDETAAEYYLKARDPLVPFSDGRFTPDYPEALNNLGLLAYTYDNDDEAIALYTKALSIKPDYADARWNLGNAYLRQYCSKKPIDVSLAWLLYDYRFYREGGVKLKNTKEGLLAWDRITPVKDIVVLAEQGHGDKFMFGRYLSVLQTLCDNIYVQCDPSLAPIYNALGYATCSDAIETPATHAVPICSLARCFPSSIPPGNWLESLRNVKTTTSGILNIGVTWSGSTTHANDHYRSAPSRYFRSLSRYGRLFNINPTNTRTPDIQHVPVSSWMETITALDSLDLVITVDTSIAHLCGSLGMECWVIMPLKETDFRWGSASMGFDNIWYPSIRVIRNPGSWDTAFAMVEVLLREKCSNIIR